MGVNLFQFYEGILKDQADDDINEEFVTGSITQEIEKDGKKENMAFYVEGMTHYSYPNFIKYFSKQVARNLISKIEKELSTTIEPGKLDFLIKKIQYDLKYYINKLQNHSFILKYPFFLEDLNSIIPDIENKCNFYSNLNPITNYQGNTSLNTKEIAMDKTTETTQTKAPYPKLKWLGKTNVLLTLFYDLINGQDNKEALVEADKNDIKSFLLKNFLDADGNTLSEATITTIFTPSKGEKRANRGDRIELSNVKLKNPST